MSKTLFVTGTDTGVGKTVLSVLLTRTLIARGHPTLAVKPLCSGGREDAHKLFIAQEFAWRNHEHDPTPEIDHINPWCFEALLTPLIAARRAGRPVQRGEVVSFLRSAREGRDVMLVEGAGGLLSPLGEDLDARHLIRALDATPLVVASNRLGVLNHTLLTWEALPPRSRVKAHLVLMEPARADAVSRTNAEFLVERLGAERVHCFPRLPSRPTERLSTGKIPERIQAILDRLVAAVLG